jgi:hypothetical protein
LDASFANVKPESLGDRACNCAEPLGIAARPEPFGHFNAHTYLLKMKGTERLERALWVHDPVHGKLELGFCEIAIWSTINPRSKTLEAFWRTISEQRAGSEI